MTEMTVFTIKLAGIPFEVNAAYDTTRSFCKEYLTDETPLFSITITQNHIEKMRKNDISTAITEGITPVAHSDSYYETYALADVALEKLIDYNVIMFHGAVMAIDGKAYLFTAKSGTGKTTHCRLWLKNIPNCHILNGDKPLLLFKGNEVFVCGSPGQGKENYGINEILPLAAVCILERADNNHIEEVALKNCFDSLINQTHIPDGNGNFAKAVGMVKQLSSVELYRLGCNMDDDAALVSYKAMVKK